MSSAAEAVLEHGPSGGSRGDNGGGFALLAARGSGWIGAAQAARHGVQLGLMVLLARLLGPEDFGLFAMAAVFMDLFLVLSDFDLGAIVVARRELGRRELSSLLWLGLLAGVTVGAVTFALTPWLVELYGEPRLEPVLRLLSLSFVLAPLGALAVGVIERRLDFRRVAVVDTLAVMVAAVVATTMALRGWGVLSLAGLTVSTLGARTLLAWALAGWQPAAVFSLDRLREPVRFGLRRTLHRTLYVIHKHADAFLLGRYVGAVGLGHYRLASQIILGPLLGLTFVLWRVSFPLFASVQGDLARVRTGYVRAVGWVALATFPVLGWMLGSADEVVATVFGSRWEAAVPIVRIFCLAGAVQVVISTLDPVLLAIGRSDVLLKMAVVTLPINVLPLWIGLRWGPEGVAWAFLGSATISGLLCFRVANEALGLSAVHYVPSLLWPALAMLAAAGAATLVRFVGGGDLIERLLIQIAAATVASAAVLWLGRPPALDDVLQTATAARRGTGGRREGR